ncbi:Dyp-type peroxidase [Shewanella sp. 202IG2-18]|uniref:Dyp-type peroxidase n=1 Tax=Parashewanella hymeniacidonis TaxID=2807618 RepID=UPI001961699C|nr:Dyp-type peroxidase [Parashewanella hymeniacidonis]MBM7072328.1 Dyp-type peroxidase [Parashewanella hymeniacidonis]
MDIESMPREQLGICAEGNLHSIYLMYNARDHVEPLLRPCLASVAQYIFEQTDQHADSAFNGFVAVGANYWDSLYPDSRPQLLRPFPSIQYNDLVAPAIEFDLFFHIRCDRYDVLHLVANEIHQMLEGLVELVDEERGFRYMDSRDLTGFVDGTENPKGRQRQQVALVEEEDEEFQGGSYVHVQKYEHKLNHWHRLPQKEQEDIIARTKQDDIEYAAEDKPLTSHIKRVNLKDENGKPKEILRQSMPFGSLRQQGLMFISVCRTPAHFEDMLTSMIKGDGHGHTDKLMEYTQALTGSSFFAPSLDFLLEKV